MLKIGHRGAPRVAPANTMASFRAAYELGCTWVECDCRPSADGVIMLAHDEHVTTVDGRRCIVRDHSLTELQALDLGNGEGVPTLQELVGWAIGRVGVMADVKEPGWQRQIGEALEPLPPEQKVVPGADEEGRRRFRELFPLLPLSTSVDRTALPEIDGILARVDTEAVTPEHPLVTRERVDALHARGIRVYVWTVDDLDLMRRLAGFDVDGLISNRADLLGELGVLE